MPKIDSYSLEKKLKSNNEPKEIQHENNILAVFDDENDDEVLFAEQTVGSSPLSFSELPPKENKAPYEGESAIEPKELNIPISTELSTMLEDIQTHGGNKYYYTDELKESHKSESMVRYSVSHVASILNRNVNSIRNAVKMFDEFLDIEYTTGGHVRFTENGIAQMENIFRLYEHNNFTFAQVKSFLQSREGKIYSAGTEYNQLKALIEELNKDADRKNAEVMAYIGELFRQYTSIISEQMKQIAKNTELRLEQRDSEEINALQMQKNEIDKQLSDVNLKLKQQESSRQQLVNELQEKDEKIAEMEKLTEQLREQIKESSEQLEQLKRKKLFRFF